VPPSRDILLLPLCAVVLRGVWRRRAALPHPWRRRL